VAESAGDAGKHEHAMNSSTGVRPSSIAPTAPLPSAAMPPAAGRLISMEAASRRRGRRRRAGRGALVAAAIRRALGGGSCSPSISRISCCTPASMPP
jgi:hypothetical protein